MYVQRLKRLLEFFVIGVVFGVIEDLLAVVIATDATVTSEVLVVVVVIAIPFAILSELVVDHPRFLHFERLAIRLKRTIAGSSVDEHYLKPRIHWDGHRDTVISAKHHHHRCNLCGSDFDTGEQLHEHVEQRHPRQDVGWWVIVEDPTKEIQFS